MAGGVAVTITGQDRIASTAKAAGKELANLEDASRAAADLIAQEARPRTPIRTGRLAASVRPESSAGVASVTASASYAPVVHWGSAVRHMKAQPWIAEAVESTQPEIESLYLENVQAVVDTVRGA